MERIFFDYGIEILIENERYYLIFDDGGIVVHYTTIEVDKHHANQAMKSPKDAGEMILHYQREMEKRKNR